MIAALAEPVIDRKRTRNEPGPDPALSTRMSRPRMVAASPGSAASRGVPSRTKSLFGSKMTIGSAVCCRICSRATPSANVLPEPDCPHQKVCRFSRRGTSPNGTSGTEASEPTVRAAPAPAR